MARIYLQVIARFDEDGDVVPLYVILQEEQFKITNVKVINQKVRLIRNEIPIKYQCIIRQQIKLIYYDRNNNQWYSIRS